jgi:hypothetical protein
MTCSRNLSKHLKSCYQSKTSKEMSQQFIFIFFKSSDFSLQKKSNILFSYLFFTFVQIFKQNKKICHHMCIWMFSITLSHFEIITWILCMMSAITIFEESCFIFSFVNYGFVTKSFGTRCTFEQVAKKKKCQKMNVNFLTTNIRWII